jgi:hypothetical protein
MTAGPLASLRRLTRPRDDAVERCELCGAPLPQAHAHLLDVQTEVLTCACRACALLFTGQAEARYRPVPDRVRSLPGLVLTDEQWESLDVPVGLAFFTRSSRRGRVVARYPSPAGPTESQLGLSTWEELEAANPALRELRPDVEALLVNRVGTAADNLIVPIDRCYALVGLVRMGWKGTSGGAEVWGAVAAYFADLRARAEVAGHA